MASAIQLNLYLQGQRPGILEVGIDRSMVLRFIRFIVFLSLLFFTAPMLFPCNCVVEARIEENLESASAVFIGKVTEVQGSNTYFEIEKVLKGKKADTLVVHREGDKNCDFDFSQGVEYFVFANGPFEHLTVSKCSPTSEWGRERFSASVLDSGLRLTPYQIGIALFLIIVAILLYSNLIPRKNSKAGKRN